MYRKHKNLAGLIAVNKEVNMVEEKIMIVDDNRDLLLELNEILECSGYCPISVSDPSIAFEAAQEEKPDVILLDLKMDGINGFQVAHQLKKSKKTAGIPIICMSGYFPVDKRSTLLDTSDMDACIKKPFGILDLLTEIERVLAYARIK